MDYEELKLMWEKYDKKLDNLEKMNKKIIRETLLRRPRRNLNWHKFQNLYGLGTMAIPIIIIVAMHPNFKLENLDFKFVIGCILTLGVIIYLSYVHIKSCLILKKINLETDPVMDSAIKIANFKSLHNINSKYVFLYYPIIFIGFLLTAWNHFHFGPKTITFLVLIFVITYALNIRSPKIYRNRIKRFEKEVINLKEYMD